MTSSVRLYSGAPCAARIRPTQTAMKPSETFCMRQWCFQTKGKSSAARTGSGFLFIEAWPVRSGNLRHMHHALGGLVIQHSSQKLVVGNRSAAIRLVLHELEFRP